MKTQTILNLGLSPVEASEWIEPFDEQEHRRFLKHKQQEINADATAVKADGAALDALRELHKMLRNNVLQFHRAEALQMSLKNATENEAVKILTEISGWIPDDICIMQPASDLKDFETSDHDTVLTASSVLSPSHWLPTEKFMQPLATIHRPIPGFDATLTPKITKFLNTIKVDRAVVRFNWGIQPGNALNWQNDTELDINHDTPLYYRTERQTLIRLPETQAIAFLIKIKFLELSDAALDDVRQELFEHINALPPVEREYKSLDRLAVAFTKYQ
jgi:hypothetical protein